VLWTLLLADSRLCSVCLQTCRNAAVRKEVSDAIIKAMVSVKSAEISPQNLVVRFSESLDGFPLPKGYSENPELQAPPKGD